MQGIQPVTLRMISAPEDLLLHQSFQLQQLPIVLQTFDSYVAHWSRSIRVLKVYPEEPDLIDKDY